MSGHDGWLLARGSLLYHRLCMYRQKVNFGNRTLPSYLDNNTIDTCLDAPFNPYRSEMLSKDNGSLIFITIHR